MDRNPGTLDNKSHEATYIKEKFYQFGRKDPFNANGSIWTYDKDTYAATKYTYGGRIYTSRSTIETVYNTGGENMPYSVMHPREFITNGGAWTDGQFNPTPYNSSIVWQDPQISAKADNEEAKKSIFDPCPPGWSVPESNGWCKGLVGDGSGDATGSPYVNFQWLESAIDAKGRTYYPNGYLADKDNPSAQMIFFPASGTLNSSGFGIVNTIYWSCSKPSGHGTAYRWAYNSNEVFSPAALSNSFGFSIRCIQEK